MDETLEKGTPLSKRKKWGSPALSHSRFQPFFNAVIPSIMSFFSGSVDSHIFADRSVLSRDYTPGEIVGRRDEKEAINTEIKNFLGGITTTQLMFTGPNGTGKTATARWTLNELEKLVDEGGVDFDIYTYFVYCPKRGETENDLLLSVCNDMLQELEDNPDLLRDGVTTKQLRRKFGELLDDHSGRVVFVLDEIDVMSDSDLNETLDAFSRPELYDTTIALIATANEMALIEDRVDGRVKSALDEEEIKFQPYTAPQLQKLVRQRIASGFKDGAVDEGVLRLIAAKAARYQGDARYALDLLKAAGEMAEERDDDKVTEEHVDLAEERVQVGLLEQKLQGSTSSLQLTLLALCESKLSKNSPQMPSADDIQRRYEVLSNVFKSSTVGRRQLMNVLQSLEEEYSLVDSTYEGSEGKKVYALKDDPDILAKAIFSNSHLDVGNLYDWDGESPLENVLISK